MPYTWKREITIINSFNNNKIGVKDAKKDIEKAEKKAHKLSVTTKSHVNRYSK